VTIRRSIVAAGACAVALSPVTAPAATKPSGASPVGHWEGRLQYAAGGAGADLVDLRVRGSGRTMTGSITYLGNPCYGPLRKPVWQGAGRWRFRYSERSHSTTACPARSDYVQLMRVGPDLFVRATSGRFRITGLLTRVI
jgi:hypothetical protein